MKTFISPRICFAQFFSITCLMLLETLFASARPHSNKFALEGTIHGHWEATERDGKVDIFFYADLGEGSHFTTVSMSPSVFQKKRIKAEAGQVILSTEKTPLRGDFSFTVNNTFTAFLLKNSISDIQEMDLMSMTLFGVNVQFIRQIQTSGIDNISARQLVNCKILNIDKSYIKLIEDNGYHHLTAAELIAAKTLGINKGFFPVESSLSKELKIIPFKYLLVYRSQELSNGHGDRGAMDSISMDYLNQSITRLLTIKEWANISNSPVSLFTRLTYIGFEKIAVKQVQDLSLNDVDDNYLEFLTRQGYKGIPLHAVVVMKSIGIKESFVQSLKRLGYSGLSYTELLGFKSLNIDSSYITGINSFSAKPVSASWLITYRTLNITPDFISRFDRIGFKNLNVGQVALLKHYELRPEDISLMKNLGYDYKSIDEYIQNRAVLKSIKN